jgi:hypothetical protein
MVPFFQEIDAKIMYPSNNIFPLPATESMPYLLPRRFLIAVKHLANECNTRTVEARQTNRAPKRICGVWNGDHWS